MSKVKRFGVDIQGREFVDCVRATDFDAEHALRLQAERQVGYLRERLHEQCSICNELAQETSDTNEAFFALKANRDAAVALLREYVEWFDDGVGRSLKEFHLFQRGREFLNTTSTEGKDHE